MSCYTKALPFAGTLRVKILVFGIAELYSSSVFSLEYVKTGFNTLWFSIVKLCSGVLSNMVPITLAISWKQPACPSNFTGALYKLRVSLIT